MLKHYFFVGDDVLGISTEQWEQTGFLQSMQMCLCVIFRNKPKPKLWPHKLMMRIKGRLWKVLIRVRKITCSSLDRSMKHVALFDQPSPPFNSRKLITKIELMIDHKQNQQHSQVLTHALSPPSRVVHCVVWLKGSPVAHQHSMRPVYMMNSNPFAI